MATNRLYIVDTQTNKYCCIAKGFDSWQLGNVSVLDRFLDEVTCYDDKTSLLIGTENDPEFYSKYIESGINVSDGGWSSFIIEHLPGKNLDNS
jgi:hypothetical protein